MVIIIIIILMIMIIIIIIIVTIIIIIIIINIHISGYARWGVRCTGKNALGMGRYGQLLFTNIF